jgi:hypothetical protein
LSGRHGNKHKRKKPKADGAHAFANEVGLREKVTDAKQEEILDLTSPKTEPTMNSRSLLKPDPFDLAIHGFILTFILALAAIWSGWIFQQQLTEARRATLLGQRASVFVTRTNVTTGKEAKTGSKAWGFTPEMENAGNTAALDVRNYVSQNSPEYEILPDSFDYADRSYAVGTFPNSNMKSGPAIVGPHETMDLATLGVSDEALQRVNKGSGHVYFWGWVSYRDIFKCTHRTEFCEELIAMSDADKDGNRHFVFNNCNQHNCADDTCQDYEPTQTKICRLASETK